MNPGQGFGIQVMYSDDMSLRESYIIKNGDSVAIKNGYHPVQQHRDIRYIISG